MKKSFILITLFFSISGQSQNLVLNPDFEQFHCYPWSISSIEDCDNWSNPTLNSPDYFNNDCKENKTSVIPDYHWWGYQLPESGNSYAGFFAYRPTNNKPEESVAEYIEGELASPLKANEKYIVKLNVSLAECSTLALKKLEIYFSENKIKEKTVLLLKYNPQVVSHININDTAKWVTIEETYIAKGNEKYLTIGCFNNGEKIKYDKVANSKAIKDPRGEAYYFIDDVSITPEIAVKNGISENNASKVIDLPKNKVVKLEQQTITNKVIIYFDSNKNELNKSSVHILDSIASFLLSAKDYQVSINGYCDNSGEESKNQSLSEKRANTISNYLKNKNIPKQFISAKGFSSNNPISNNNSEIGKAKNRRAEIIININAPLGVQPPLMKAISITPPVSVDSGTITKTEMLNPDSKVKDLEVGKIFIIRNLNFHDGTADLLSESKPALKELLKLMKDNPSLEIEIEGHVCCENNMEISVERALTVLEYLVNNGISENRLKYAGHSNNNPIANDNTEEGRKQNRRVEIMILKQ